MGFNDILKSLFGNKSDRDMKELMPIVAKVNAEWEKLKSISADELRAVAEDMKKEVREYIGEEENEIAALKRKVEVRQFLGKACDRRTGGNLRSYR